MTFNETSDVRRAVLLLLLAVCVSCKPAQQQSQKPSAAGPRVRATVVTITTTVNQPEEKTFTRTLVIAGDKARDLGEPDVWRLYDTKAKTVTFVDDIGKTIRTEPFATVASKRRATMSAALPPYFPRAKFTRTSERRAIQGVNAQRAVIESGTYKRELWLAEHPAIPRELFAMMQLSETPSSPLAPMMRAVDEAIASTRGFPLADRTTIPLRAGNLVIERTVTAIAQREVPQTMLALPKDYEDVTPKPPPAKKK